MCPIPVAGQILLPTLLNKGHFRHSECVPYSELLLWLVQYWAATVWRVCVGVSYHVTMFVRVLCLTLQYVEFTRKNMAVLLVPQPSHSLSAARTIPGSATHHSFPDTLLLSSPPPHTPSPPPPPHTPSPPPPSSPLLPPLLLSSLVPHTPLCVCVSVALTSDIVRSISCALNQREPIGEIV